MKKEALSLSAAEDTQMKKVRKALQTADLTPKVAYNTQPASLTPAVSMPLQPTKILKREVSRDPIEELTRGLQEMRIMQATMNSEIARFQAAAASSAKHICEGQNCHQQTMEQKGKPRYVSPTAYGNRTFGDQIDGCWWCGGNHGREGCQHLLDSIGRGDCHKEGKIVYTGTENMVGRIRIPIPQKDKDGKVGKWQKDMLEEILKKKESEMERTQIGRITAGEEDSDDEDYDEEVEVVNGRPAILRRVKPTCEVSSTSASVEEKRGRSYNDVGKEESKKQRVSEDKKEKVVRIPKIVEIEEPKPDLPKPNKRKQRKDVVYNLAEKIRNVEI